MTRRARRLVAVFSWAAFLIAVPLVVGYSLGHRVSPTSPVPAPVGAFLIRTFPRGATVFINEKKYSSKTPTAVRSLAPELYTVRLEKAGYRSWEKRLGIRGTRVTDIRHVRLIPAAIEEDIVRRNVLDFSISPKEQWLTLIEEAPRGKRLRIVPLDQFLEPGILADIRLEKKEQVSFLWAPSEERFMLVVSGGTRRYLVVDTSTGRASQMRGIDEMFEWLPGSTDRFVARRGSDAVVRSLPRNDDIILSRRASSIAVFRGGTIVVEQQEGALTQGGPPTLRVFSGTGTFLETLPTPPLDGQRVSSISASPFGDLALLTFPNQHLFLWDNSTRAWRRVAEHAEHLQWSPDGEKVLWQSSEFEIWVMNIRERRAVLPRFVPELVVRLSVAVRDVRWFAGSQHVLFLERDVVQLAEIDGRDSHHIESLLGTNLGDGRAQVTEDGATIFATGRREDASVLLRAFLRIPQDR